MLEFEELNLNNWNKWEVHVLNSECAFPECIREDAHEYIEVLSTKKPIGIVAKENKKYIGNAIGCEIHPEEAMEYSLDPKDNIVILNNIVIDEHHQGKGYGKEVLTHFIKCAKKEGYRKLVGYFREKQSLGLIKKFGAKEISVEKNWFGSEETFVFCILDI